MQYPVNIDGIAVAEDGGRYYQVDETTDGFALDQNGSRILQLNGPASCMTQTDAYGNMGYYVIANLAPGNYRLRYVFPDGYETHALKSRQLARTLQHLQRTTHGCLPITWVWLRRTRMVKRQR